MTWGSNATYAKVKCRYCGGPDIDDADSGLSTHERVCPVRIARHGGWICIAIIGAAAILAGLVAAFGG